MRDISNSKSRPFGLVVEDHPIAAVIVKHYLNDFGCRVHIAKNGKMAISKAKKNKYDFILMDIGLPDLDGYAVTQAIRNMEASNNDTKPMFIAVLTGHMATNTKKFKDAGINLFITKPLDKENLIKLFAAVSEHLKEESICF